MKAIRIIVLLTDRFNRPQEWRLEIPAMPPQEAAELVFEISNAPPDFLNESKREILAKFPRNGLRSVSVGDILIIEDIELPGVSHVLSCQSFGFQVHGFQNRAA